MSTLSVRNDVRVVRIARPPETSHVFATFEHPIYHKPSLEVLTSHSTNWDEHQAGELHSWLNNVLEILTVDLEGEEREKYIQGTNNIANWHYLVLMHSNDMSDSGTEGKIVVAPDGQSFLRVWQREWKVLDDSFGAYGAMERTHNINLGILWDGFQSSTEIEQIGYRLYWQIEQQHKEKGAALRQQWIDQRMTNRK